MVRVSTIPAGVPFVDALASGLLAESSKTGADGDALALADMLVLLPNRRACRSLRDAFWRAGKGRAMALPSIQPIGDLDAEDLLLDADAELDLPPPIGLLRRRLLLTRLLKPLGLTAHQAGRLAEDLGELLDELQTERVPLSALDRLVPDMFAAHWQKSLRLLQVIGEHWPALLADEQAIDPAERRHRLLVAVAERWAAERPSKRIVAAGSTGSIPATRKLLEVIAGLPAGEVVLPGLDQELDEESWAALTPQHPQEGLRQLLEALGVDRREVELWPLVEENDDRPAARRWLLSATMRPSGAPALPKEEGDQADQVMRLACDGLTLAEHADPAAEALAITLRLRAALLEEGRRAALITPDRTLARRVVVELRRFGIEIDDSAGMSLDRTAPGSFLLLTAKLVVDEVRPVALLSVLKHPLMRAGLEADEVRRRARALDRLCLRGPAILGGFRQIIDELGDLRRGAGDDRAELQDELLELQGWIEALAGLAKPFADLAAVDEVSLSQLAAAHLRFVEALASVDGSAEALWAKEAGQAAADLFRDLLTSVDPEDRLPPAAYPPLLATLMTARLVRPRRSTHPRLSIYGQLEARLQQADLTIIAGLNEGVWPRATEPGPWLNPSMRESLGLPPLERRVGQAAHDFVQAAAGGEVVLSRAEKDLDGSPTVPSRWLVRLKATLDGRVAEGWRKIQEKPDWRQWASTLDLPTGRPSPEPQPTPKPPLAARPRKLSVSDVGLWMTDAYALYAKRILQLRPLEALEGDPEAGDRGTIIHEALERFVRAYPGALPEDALGELRACGQKAFARFDQRPQVQVLWWPRFLEAAAWVVATEEARRDTLERILVEVKGELVIDVPVGPFRLTARADRLERRADGGVVIVDYKTGKPPGKSDMALGRAPQLPLEGAIFQADGFASIDAQGGRSTLAGMEFWQLAGGEEGGRLETRSTELVEAALDGLTALVRHYDQESTPYPAAYRPPTANRRGDYDHLARLGEWPN